MPWSRYAAHVCQRVERMGKGREQLCIGTDHPIAAVFAVYRFTQGHKQLFNVLPMDIQLNPEDSQTIAALATRVAR